MCKSVCVGGGGGDWFIFIEIYGCHNHASLLVRKRERERRGEM